MSASALALTVRRVGAPTASWGYAGIAGGLVLPLASTAFLLSHPALNAGAPSAPWVHFALIGMVGGLCLLVAGLLMFTSLRIRHYKVLFWSYGLLAYGGFSAVDALTTPGILLPAAAGLASIPSIAAYLAFLSAACLFALAQTRVATNLTEAMPFVPVSWFVATLGVAMAGFLTLALTNPGGLAGMALLTAPYSAALGGCSIALFGVCAWHYLRAYTATGLPIQLNLAVVLILFAEAQAILAVSPVGSWSRWSRYLILIVALVFTLRTLLKAGPDRKSVRTAVEASLGLGVSVHAEVRNLSALAALSAAIEGRDREMAGHNARVASLAVRVGQEMNLDNSRVRVLARAGLLHDIGKLDIPEAILGKPGPLTKAERAVMQTHPLRELGTLGKMGDWGDERAAIIAHHERIDGSGYPFGKAGEEIPLEARIIAVVDTYDAMTSERVYQRARTPETACAILRAEAGARLDAACVEALLAILGAQPSLAADPA